MPMNYERLEEAVKKKISHKRFLHSLGVVETAVELARRYGAQEDPVKIAAICHDCAKDMDRRALLELAQRHGLELDPVVHFETQLMHGPVGSLVARFELGIEDEEILSAIACHTTGKHEMNLMEKIIYLSDFIEPGRNYAGVDALRILAFQDLDRAMIQAFDNTIRYVLSLDSVLHPATIEARNHLIMKIGGDLLDQQAQQFAQQIKDWIEEKNGTNVEIIDVHELTPMTDYFVIASGSSTLNVKAIAEHVELMGSRQGTEPLSYEGRQGGRWILIDFNSVVVHIFLEEERGFYNLERLWQDGKRV